MYRIGVSGTRTEDGPPAALRVPFAVAEGGGWIAPREARRSVRLACPDCGGRLIVREGPERIRHFAHHRPPEGCRFEGESALHAGAKYAVLGAIRRWREGRTLPPEVESFCASCRVRVERRPVRDSVKEAALERECPLPRAGAVCRFDVAFLGAGGRILLGVEIRHAHAVPDEKRRRMRVAGIPWIEIEAAQALEDEGRRLVAIAGERVGLSFECAPCREARESAARRASAAARARRLAAPSTAFERSLDRARSWSARQRETLGRMIPRDRAGRLLELLCIVYPESRHILSCASRFQLTGSIPPFDAARLVWIARRGAAAFDLGPPEPRPRPPPPPDAKKPADRTLFDSGGGSVAGRQGVDSRGRPG